jgi:hypothetical protein
MKLGAVEPMRPRLKIFSLLLASCLTLSSAEGDPAWKSKPMKQWDSEDARQVLNDSPWSKSVAPQWVRDLSPDERRAGGDMQADKGEGVGLEGLIGIFDPAREAEAIARAHAKPDPGTVVVRWESARPVRAAEQKVADSEAPALNSDEYYAIAVYDIPTPTRFNIEKELKGIAFLRRDKKKDFKPSRVVIERKDGELATVVYLFPRSEEITKRDGYLVFYAQIGRLVVERVFSTSEMQIRGELEL